MSWKLASVDFLPLSSPRVYFLVQRPNESIWKKRNPFPMISSFLFFFFLFFPAILMNRYDQLVARRRINVKKGNRCSCVKSSECTCINKNDETNTRYKHVKMKDYHVAHLEEKKLSPKIPEEPKVSPTIWPGVMTISWPNVMTIVCSVSTILLLFLLLLGNLEINLGFFFFFEKRGLKEEFFY